jgi:hypothetical protein
MERTVSFSKGLGPNFIKVEEKKVQSLETTVRTSVLENMVYLRFQNLTLDSAHVWAFHWTSRRINIMDNVQQYVQQCTAEHILQLYMVIGDKSSRICAINAPYATNINMEG